MNIYVALVPLPALCTCPECGMTNVVKTVHPVVMCRDCTLPFWAKGVIVGQGEMVDLEVL